MRRLRPHKGREITLRQGIQWATSAHLLLGALQKARKNLAPPPGHLVLLALLTLLCLNVSPSLLRISARPAALEMRNGLALDGLTLGRPGYLRLCLRLAAAAAAAEHEDAGLVPETAHA